MIVYLSGKISGLDIEVAKQLFQVAENKMLELGYEVINPMKLPCWHDKTWEERQRQGGMIASEMAEEKTIQLDMFD